MTTDLSIPESEPVSKAGILGAFDGLGCFLGVALGLTGHQALILPAAIGVGAAETVSMAAAQWLSESDKGFAASAAIGIATGAGAVLPALPYELMPGWYARAWSIVIIALIAALIAWRRAGDRGLRRSFAETYGVLVVIALVVGISVHFTP